jgi:valyl-tRNA synthetase
MKQLETHYNHLESDGEIYSIWESSGYFNPDKQSNIVKGAKPFTIIMPPPNANGSLHIGHAVFVTIEDIMIRYNRMLGKPTLWVPGADHAGFETQVVFEKKLEKEGKSRFQFNREELYKMIWDFTEKNKSHMENQLRQLGASCDWSRKKFTLDKDIIHSVYKNFKKLYEDGLIYRSEKPVNWCTKHQTSLSDLELKVVEQIDSLYYIKYGPITIATTRPETMFADVAVAVNPKDKKYKKFIGTNIKLPLTNREIPVIADKDVDPKFGTGALKITPAHDITDFEIGKRHKLNTLLAINERGKLTDLAGEFEGLKVLEAREKVVEKLKKIGVLEKVDTNYTHTVSRCYKCNNIIEPRILPQWFVKMDKLAKIGLEEVSKGKVKFVTKKFEKIYRHWLSNIRDWNISRQIVWGIRIPAWFCNNNSTIKPCLPIITSGEKPTQCPNCGSKDLTQDTDVFDTWFSSGQWPFLTLENNKPGDFKKYYPTTVMETAWDILFFWVARMIMFGKYLTNKEPFKYVYIHGLVRDKDRQKMSKSKGNVIDPLGISETYSVDAVRMALIFGAGTGNDTVISEDKIRAMRNFATKIWNASRFVMLSFEDTEGQKAEKQINNLTMKQFNNLAITKADKSILKKLDQTINNVTKNIDAFRFGQAANIIYEFFWHEFCDYYLEESKKQLQDKKLKENTQKILFHTLIQSLKLLHPFMPFITEKIYQHLRLKISDKQFAKCIIISDWPKA